jgi:hypothetical protein
MRLKKIVRHMMAVVGGASLQLEIGIDLHLLVNEHTETNPA